MATLLARPRWMAALAKATPPELEAAWSALADKPAFTALRGPEAGLVMVRGRAGGTGDRFHLGEMTVTRCTVRLADGTVGHAYIAGRNRRKAELAALFDALMQAPARRPWIEANVIRPLSEAHRSRRELASRKAAATKVEFFTMVRGDDPT